MGKLGLWPPLTLPGLAGFLKRWLQVGFGNKVSHSPDTVGALIAQHRATVEVVLVALGAPAMFQDQQQAMTRA
jgi:hypothetical protein